MKLSYSSTGKYLLIENVSWLSTPMMGVSMPYTNGMTAHMTAQIRAFISLNRNNHNKLCDKRYGFRRVLEICILIINYRSYEVLLLCSNQTALERKRMRRLGFILVGGAKCHVCEHVNTNK